MRGREAYPPHFFFKKWLSWCINEIKQSWICGEGWVGSLSQTGAIKSIASYGKLLCVRVCVCVWGWDEGKCWLRAWVRASQIIEKSKQPRLRFFSFFFFAINWAERKKAPQEPRRAHNSTFRERKKGERGKWGTCLRKLKTLSSV